MKFKIGEKVYFVYDGKVRSGTIESEGCERNEVTGDKDLFPTYFISVRDENNDVETYIAISCQGAIFTSEESAFRSLQNIKICEAIRLLHTEKIKDALVLLNDYLDSESIK